MSLRLKIIQRKQYLVANFSGAGTVDEMSQQFAVLAEQMPGCQNEPVVGQCLCNSSCPFLFGSVPGGGKSGGLRSRWNQGCHDWHPGQIDPGLLGELVARNRDVDGHVFSDLVAAKKWLLEKPGA